MSIEGPSPLNALSNLLPALQQRMRNQGRPKIAAFEQKMVAGIPGFEKLRDARVDDPNDFGIDHDANQWTKPVNLTKEDETRVVNYVVKQFDIVQRSRQEMELEWKLANAFFEGRQWLRINSQARNLKSIQNPDEPTRYVTIQKMRPLIDGVVGKLSQVGPDSRAVPLSENPKDRLAADEANIICANYNRKFKRETQLKERIRWACVTGTVYVKVWWDANQEQTVPLYDAETGEISGFEKMKVGDLCEEILPCFDVYLDPTAKTDEQVRWLIHAAVKPMSWFTDNYGEKGKAVQANATTNTNAQKVDAYIDGGAGDLGGYVPPSSARLLDKEARKMSAIVYEYWEKPSQQYPEGRFIVCTDKVLLYAGPWLYKKKDEFPFIPLRWQPRSGTPYGYSLGFDLAPLQQTYNRIYSRMLEQFEQQRDYAMVQRRSGIGADAFNHMGDDREDDNRTIRKIYYEMGSAPPQIYRSPGVGNELITFLQLLEKDMQMIAGMHDVSQGQAPAGTPAEAVMMLQKSDNTQHSYIRADMEISSAKIKEWEISLVEQFGIVPFVGSTDEENNPSEDMAQGIVNFEHIRNGGNYRIVYVPGSTQQDSPEQKLQKLMAFRQMGLFGDPQDPATNRLVVTMVNMPETSRILQHLDEQEQAMAAAQQAMAEQQAAMAEQQQATTRKFDPEAMQMQTELDIQKQQEAQSGKLEADIAKMRERSRLLQENEAAKSITEVGREKLKAELVPQRPKNSSS